MLDQETEIISKSSQLIYLCVQCNTHTAISGANGGNQCQQLGTRTKSDAIYPPCQLLYTYPLNNSVSKPTH